MLIPRTVYHVGLARSFDVCREQLQGVFLERKGDRCSATATNGKILARASWKEPDWQEYPVPMGSGPEHGLFEPCVGFSLNAANTPFVGASRSICKKPRRPILEFVALDEASGTYHTTSDSENWGRWSATRIEGTFPVYGAAFNPPLATEAIRFAPEYLKMAIDIVTKVCDDRHLVLEIQLTGHDLPPIIRGKGKDWGLFCEALPMPMVVG